MKNFLCKCTLVLLPIILSGCSSLAVMKRADRISGANSETALINFVRPHIFIGDGVDFEVWDGSSFVGTLESGAMIQYVARPGNHCFMIDATQSGWTHVNIEVAANRTYYLKPNTGFASMNLGVANELDERIPTWNNDLRVMIIDKTKTKPLPAEAVEEAKSKEASFKTP